VKEYDLVIIGSGPAGYTAAFEAKKFNMTAAIVERDPGRLGGVCLSEGCIPLKGLLYHSHSAGDYRTIRDMVMKRVELIRSGLSSRLRGQGIDIIKGEAAFLSREELSVDGDTIKAKHFLIASGSSPKKIFDYPNVHTSEKIFDLERVPAAVLIIGGGVVGCEYASFLGNIGAQVDIVEALDSPLYGEDEEAVRVMTREFRKKNINVFAKSSISSIGPGNEVSIQSEKQMQKTYDMIFEATGRRPNTGGMGLDAAGVKLTVKGFISVNESMQTSTGSIYAAGDCIETPMLAYTAYKEAESAVRHCATGKTERIDYETMPRLVFSTPQIGGVGWSEKKAGEKNINYRIYKYFFKALGKAVMEGRDAGFVKLVADADSDTIMGASAVGDDISDIMNQLALIVKAKVKISEIMECMFVHPSYSEIILEALQYGKQ
jgi:dihydrolipoamide dehydrogenase